MFSKLRNKLFGTIFVLRETQCRHTTIKKVYSSKSGLYVKGLTNVGKFFFNKDGSFYGRPTCGGDPVKWTLWRGYPSLDEMELNTLNINKG